MRSFGNRKEEPPQAAEKKAVVEEPERTLDGTPIEANADGDVINPDVDLSLPTRNMVDGRLMHKTFLPDGRVVNGVTGKPWTEEDSVALYGEDSLAREPAITQYSEAELAEAVALWEEVKRKAAKR